MDRFFEEHEGVGNIQRMTYLSDLERFLAREQADSAAARDRFMADYPDDLEGLRARYRDMLGWPLNTWRDDLPPVSVHSERLGEDAQAEVFRLTLEVLPGVRFGGVLFRLHGGARRPLVIGQHGGKGTPEIISGMYDGGHTWNYNGMVRRVLARGANVFAPQLLLWDQEKYHIHYDRIAMDRALKQLGGSIAALEIYAIMRCIDALLRQPWADPARVGMVGLSYGGFYAMYTAAADPRIRSCLASGFFSDRLVYNWPDWVWQDAAHTFLDAEVGALVAARTLLLELGTRDEIFDTEPSRRELRRLQGLFERAGCADRLAMEFFDGVHEFSRSDVLMDRFMDAL